MDDPRYDVLIVGAGVAGCEAAYALVGRGLSVGLLTQSLDTVGLAYTVPETFPATGLLHELHEPGLSVWTLHRRVKYALEREPGIHLFQSTASGLLVGNSGVRGVRTWEGPQRTASATVLATGSFLGATLRQGSATLAAGRLGEDAYPELFGDLLAHSFRFTEARRELLGEATSPGYQVRFMAFSPGEYEAETGRLMRISGLYGIGACVDASITACGAAEGGRQLGLRLTPRG